MTYILRKSTITLSFLFVFTALFAGNPPVKLFTESNQKKSANAEFDYTSLIVDETLHDQIYSSRSSTITLDIPYLDKVFTVELYAFDLLTPDFKLKTNSGEVDYTPGLYYRGVIAETGGMVAISFFEDDIMGILATKKGKMLNLGKPESGLPNEYVIYNSNDVKSPPNMECHAEDLPEYAGQLQTMYDNVASTSKMGDCVNVYVEGDYTMNIVKGGVVQATNYITGLWGPVTTIFDNESVDVNISEIFVWDEADGYSTTSSSTALNQFKTNNPTYNGDLAHLMALGGNGLGGVAWLDVICSSNFGYAYSNISANYNSFPSYSWTINVVTHEFGHNLGSPHTHACFWNGDNTAIDGCGPTAGYSEGCTAPLPTDGGTIMSYCHLVGGVGIDFNNGFGTQPGDKIRDEVDDASCLGNCQTLSTGDPPIADFDWDVIEECANDPAEVHYFDESEDDPTEWLWTFPGGDPSSSTDQNPIVTYDTPGTYDATLEVSNDYGDDEITYQDVITVLASPQVAFTTIIADNVVFTDNLSQNSLNYQWDFGDGFVTTVFEPIHTYVDDGFYTITLTGFNSCGSVEYTEEIEIATAPEASFTMTEGSGCVDWVIDFMSTSSNNTDTYLWDFPGGTPSSSTDPNPQVTYTVAGVFDVSLTVANETGMDTETLVDAVVLGDVPETGFTYVIDEGEVTFTNTTTDGTNYDWDFGDGSMSTLTDPVYTYAAGGTYTVSLTATNFCGSETYTESILIELEPEAGFSYTNPEGCAVHTIQYTNESIGADSYFWEFEGGFPSTSGVENPSVDYDTKGIYEVKLTVTNQYGTDELVLTDLVVIDDVPVTDFTFTENEGVVTFTNLTTNADSYIWVFGDGNSSTDVNPTHTYEDAGEYLVTLSATNDCGDSQYITQVIAAIQPIASFDSSPLEGCVTHIVDYIYTGSNESSIEWTFPGGNPSTSTDPNPTVSYDQAGIYDVTLYVSNDYGDDEVIIQDGVIIDDVPNTSFTYFAVAGDVDFTNTSTNGSNPVWDFGDGGTSSESDPSHNYSTAGDYLVSLTTSNDCGAMTSEQTITITFAPTISMSANATSSCLPATIQFTDQSINADDITWEFEGGNPSVSTDSNPVVTYSAAGSYDVTLTATNSNGTSLVVFDDFITILPDPTANFNWENEGVEFDFNYFGQSNTVSWDFGDGNESDVTDPTHTYVIEGTYDVTATATNECGEKSRTKTIDVYTPPTAGFNVENAVYCVGDEITLNNTSSSNTTEYLWDVNGTTYTTETPSFTLNDAGVYPVSLTASNPLFSDTATFDEAITVITTPTAMFDVNEDGLSITTENQSIYASEYLWDFGDGNTSTEENPGHTYENEGLYTVTLQITNQCGVSTETFEINNYTSPSGSITTNKEEVCVGKNVRYFSNASDNTVEYSWELPGANPSTSTAKNPLVNYAQVGVYSATLTVTNPGGSESYTQMNTIIVRDEPTAAFTQVNDGLVSQFTNLSNDGTTYLWDFGDGNTSADANPAHTYGAEAFYTVTLTTTNLCGTSTETIEFHNYSAPEAAFSQNKETVCVGKNVRYLENASDNTLTYEWNMPGATPETSTAKNPTVQYAVAGTYDVTLTVTNPAGTDMTTKTSTIIVNDIPETDFTYLRDVFTVSFTENADGETSYLWDFGDGNTSDVANPTHTYAVSGDYVVTLITINECGESTMVQNLSVTTKPTAAFTVVGGFDQELCLPAEVGFQNLSSSNVESMIWTFEGGTPESSIEVNPTVTYQAAGVYDVTLEVFSLDDSDIVTIESVVTVLDVPTAGFDIDNSGIEILGTDASLNAESIVWLVNNEEVSTDPDMSYLPLFNGEYVVTQVVTNACGENTTEETIIVTAYPDAGFTSTLTDICQDNTITYEASFEENLTYTWTFEGGTPATSNDQNPTITYASPGTYDVTLSVTNIAGDSDLLNESYVIVGANPLVDVEASIDSDNLISATLESDTEQTYAWYINGELISNEEFLSYQITEFGNYIVTLVATNACGEVSFEETFLYEDDTTPQGPVSLSLDDITLVPNPATDRMSILSESESFNRITYYLTSSTGKFIMEGYLESTEDIINLTNIPGGVYIVSLNKGDDYRHEKIVVAK